MGLSIRHPKGKLSRRKIPTIRTLHADYAEDTERLRAPEGESQVEGPTRPLLTFIYRPCT